VAGFEIVTADGQLRHVKRDATDPDERDLYYAVLGGSPGNFGVITHATLDVFESDAYPHARGLRQTVRVRLF
jgi:FAD/FMN-containing dehydrogenase